MKLRTKLLLGVGILLFAMVIVMYVLPTYFVQRDIYKAADQIHGLLLESHQELVESQQTWLEDELARTVQTIDSILFMLYEEPAISSKLTFGPENPLVNVWDGISQIASFDPEIGFIQAHAPQTDQTALITPSEAQFYPLAHLSSKHDLHILALKSGEKGEIIYVGMKLPEELQDEKGYTLYALMDMKKVAEQRVEIKEEIAKLLPQQIHKHLEAAREYIFTQGKGTESAFLWAIKVDLMRTLARLYVEGLVIEPSDQRFVPEGIARVDSSGSGLAILSKEIFHTTPFFDDKIYYETHPPKLEAPPLAEGSLLATKKEVGEAFIGNTLLLDNTFLTIGVPLSHSIRQLALSSNKTILLYVKNSFWIGYDGEGNPLSQKQILPLVGDDLLNQRRGILKADKILYSFARISSLDRGNLVFYGLHPLGKEQSIIQTLLNMENRLSNRISLQLSLISLGTMVLVLLFTYRIGFSVISPITKLAGATEHIVAGRYEEVKLPEVGKRKDEVATLTRSFADMVSGLQEREKIRGVLDKVVSKDVADEILRTQIHLGGEDRIVSMLFSDIRGFSEITENATPQLTIQMLNGCMTKISRVIEGEGGVIDKYVGDEVMAIYGAPTIHPDHALRAVSSGMLMIETLKRWNEERAAEGQPLIEMGIGVHTGLVVAGNMGAEDRLNYTVLGANVNLASRLCQVAKRNQLIISAGTLAQPKIKESFHVKPLDSIVLKGFKEPVPIYEVLGFKWEE